MTINLSPLACIVLFCYSWQRTLSFQFSRSAYRARGNLDVARSKSTASATSRWSILPLGAPARHGYGLRARKFAYSSKFSNDQQQIRSPSGASVDGTVHNGGRGTPADRSTSETGKVGGVNTLTLDRPMETVHLPAGRGLRVHCLSDIHADFSGNRQWLKTWSSWKGDGDDEQGVGHEDVLLVPGDVSSSMERLEETLSDLVERYDQVFFVVGNHDLWTDARRRSRPRPRSGGHGDQDGQRNGSTGRSSEMGGVDGVPRGQDDGEEEEVEGDSVEKLLEVYRLCENLRVRTNPTTFVFGKQAAEEALVLFPLLSWYHSSWDAEPDLPPDALGPWVLDALCLLTRAELQYRNGEFLRRWQDYRRCRWPAELCSHEEFVNVARDAPRHLAEFFARQNDACIETFLARERGGGNTTVAAATTSETDRRDDGHVYPGYRRERNATVISFSHFVPRQELCPEKRFLLEPMLPKAIGSDPLELQIRRLGSDVHVYGHTHIPFDIGVEGVRYVQWPLGSSLEQSMQCKRMRQEGPLLLYDHDGQTGGLTPEQPTYWGDYYRETSRDLENVSTTPSKAIGQAIPVVSMDKILGNDREQSLMCLSGSVDAFVRDAVDKFHAAQIFLDEERQARRSCGSRVSS